jgi:SAM-dependent methyltransferase
VSKENEKLYTDGRYSELTGGSWHQEDSPYKARWVMQMLARHPDFQPKTVCEIGCGAGGILAELSKVMPEGNEFTGYEISPQAHAISRQHFGDSKIRFVLGGAFDDAQSYDLALVMDVVEHVEDCFAFLRQTRLKARITILHIPLDAHVSAILRGRNSWEDVGHIHIFTIETALKTLEHSGYKIHDWFLTEGATAAPTGRTRTNLANLLRRPLNRVNPKWTARLLGGNSMMIFAE